MHHYGEAAVKVEIQGNKFTIDLRNHSTGAVITISGPLKGAFADSARTITRHEVQSLGNDLAHFLRQRLV